jgi:cysteinyl-tRNA synthetase
MDFTFKGLQDSGYAVDELRGFHRRLLDSAGGDAAAVDASHPVLKGFIDALSDDLNMSGALGVVFEWLKKPKGKAAVNLGVLEKIDTVLGVLRMPALGDDDVLARGSLSDEDLNARLKKIDDARAAKDFATADAEKDALRALNYNVMDLPGGTVATAKPVIV